MNCDSILRMDKLTPQGIKAYNADLAGDFKAICQVLKEEIDKVLPNAESKVWHGHPVWFIKENPVVGYSALKDCVQVLFWSGQSFSEPALESEGSFKASQKRYTAVDQINKEDLKRWLGKCEKIQWDYKNIVKRRGDLVRIK